jgi:DNA polymerase-1
MSIAIDVETFPIRTGDQLPKFVCVAYCRDDGSYGLLHRDESEGFLRETLRGAYGPIVGHNVAFDMGSIVRTFPALMGDVIRAYAEHRVTCTLRWAQLADTAVGLGMKRKYPLDVTCTRLGVPCFDKGNEWRNRYGELDPLPISDWPQAATDYPKHDAISALLLAKKLRSVPDVPQQSRFDFWLKCSSALGVATDAPRVAQWAAELQARRDAITPELLAVGFIREEKGELVRTMSAIHEQVTRAYNGNPPMTSGGQTGKRKPSSSADTCRESGDSLLLRYAEWLGTLGALSREWPMLQSPIVHTRYGLVETGRTSSSRPNLQNLSRDSGSRYCFTPRPGYVYAICDFGKLELCCLGQLCRALGTGDKLAGAIRAGRDPHAMMSALILGCSESELAAHPDRKQTRLAAKAANFGFPGGAGAQSFVKYARATYGVRVTLNEARRLRKQWAKAWPDVLAYQDVIKRMIGGRCVACARPIAGTHCPNCGGDATIGTLDHYRSGRLRGGLSFTQACNTLFQGLGADVTKETGWRLMLAGFRIAAFVHDEYLIEVPRAGAVEACMQIAGIARDVCAEWLPDSPSSIEPTLATRWVKDDPAYIGGRLALIDVDNDRKVVAL